MSVDINALTLTELIALQNEINAAVDARKTDEGPKVKAKWLASDEAKVFLSKIEDLRQRYTALSKKCGSVEEPLLRIQMRVSMKPYRFDDIIKDSWERCFDEVFNIESSGKLLNKDLGELANEIQAHVDDVMSELCSEAAKVHGNGSLYKECEQFVDDFNKVISGIRTACGVCFQTTASEIVRAEAKRAAKKRAKKGKK